MELDRVYWKTEMYTILRVLNVCKITHAKINENIVMIRPDTEYQLPNIIS